MRVGRGAAGKKGSEVCRPHDDATQYVRFTGHVKPSTGSLFGAGWASFHQAIVPRNPEGQDSKTKRLLFGTRSAANQASHE